MKNYILLFFSCCAFFSAQGQSYVVLYYDTDHYASFVENHAMRITQEKILQNQTKAINDNMTQINDNMNKVILIKDMVYRYLTEVNEVLKDGRQIRYIISLVDNIIQESRGAINDVADAPEYLVFTTKSVNMLRLQSVALFSEITDLINRGGSEVMMNNGTRDALLTEIIIRLRLIRGALYNMRSTIRWAKFDGFWKGANPFRTWINQDKLVINRIIRDYEYLMR